MSHPEKVCRARFSRIKSVSLFKLIFIISLCTLGVFVFGCGIAAMFGAKTVSFGSNHITGIWGLVVSIFMIPIFSAIFGGIAWVFAYIGIRLIGRFFPITIEYVSAEETEPNQSAHPPLARGQLG